MGQIGPWMASDRIDETRWCVHWISWTANAFISVHNKLILICSFCYKKLECRALTLWFQAIRKPIMLCWPSSAKAFSTTTTNYIDWEHWHISTLGNASLEPDIFLCHALRGIIRRLHNHFIPTLMAHAIHDLKNMLLVKRHMHFMPNVLTYDVCLFKITTVRAFARGHEDIFLNIQQLSVSRTKWVSYASWRNFQRMPAISSTRLSCRGPCDRKHL